MEYSSQLEKAVAQKKANKKFLKKLSKISTRELDSRFHEEHHAVFEKIDCLKCANCCKTTSPIFRDVDIDRLSRRLRISSSEFIDRYLIMDNEMDYVLKISPCTFLQEDSTCSVYEDRPLACKEYPHTDRKKMHQILGLTLKNTEICPAVSEIFTELRKKI